MKRIAEAWVERKPTIDFSEPGVTQFFREPTSLTEHDLKLVREHLIEQERSFRETHERGKEALRTPLLEAGGRSAWPTAGEFLDKVWSTREHLQHYITELWSSWKLPGDPPIDVLLANPAWRLFFDGWGIALYGQALAHPQPAWVETADLQQLIYLGVTNDGLLATNDMGLRAAGAAIWTHVT